MARLTLSKQGHEYLPNVMVELGIDRPLALKIALAKGIASETLPKEEKKESSDFIFNTDVVAKDDELLLVKHLIINKLKRKISDQEIDKYILYFIEHGLEIMNDEINKLSNLDNYLLYLMNKHSYAR